MNIHRNSASQQSHCRKAWWLSFWKTCSTAAITCKLCTSHLAAFVLVFIQSSFLLPATFSAAVRTNAYHDLDCCNCWGCHRELGGHGNSSGYPVHQCVPGVVGAFLFTWACLTGTTGNKSVMIRIEANAAWKSHCHPIQFRYGTTQLCRDDLLYCDAVDFSSLEYFEAASRPQILL